MGFGDFNRNLPATSAEADPFNIRIRGFLDDNMPEGPENAPAEEVKRWAEHFQREDKAAQDRVENQKIADAFVAGHEEWVDNKANAELLLNQMNTMFGKGLHPLEHFEAAYDYLRTNTNFLKLDQKELEKQRKAADKQRYDAERARSVTPSEQELYELPLEDLRRLDAMENQSRLQAAGERGGNGW